jgi:uncharacterized membrane protein (UPF0127 family)
MMGKTLLAPVSFLLLLVAAAGCIQEARGNGAAVMPDGVAVALEVVKDPISQAHGLSGRESLCAQCGMLFVSGKPGPQSFWMKDMNFRLDMIFLDENFVVVDVAPGMRPCGKVCIPYHSQSDAQYVLEVNAGFAEAHGVDVGKRLEINYN